MGVDDLKQQLVALYEEVYRLTEPECRHSCRAPRSCCAPEHCSMVIVQAEIYWDVELKPTGHRIPLMGPDGCVAAPHLRPVCTLHTCAISSFGFKPNDPDWTDKYWKLRGEIDHIEFQLFEERRARRGEEAKEAADRLARPSLRPH